MPNYETEYKEVCNNLRFYGELRFKQMTVALALNGAVLYAVYARTLSWQIDTTISLLALASTYLFIVIERSSNRYWEAFCERAKELEPILEYAQYSKVPRGRTLRDSARLATKYIYELLAAIWVFVVTWHLYSAWKNGWP